MAKTIRETDNMFKDLYSQVLITEFISYLLVISFSFPFVYGALYLVGLKLTYFEMLKHFGFYCILCVPLSIISTNYLFKHNYDYVVSLNETIKFVINKYFG